ncbi:uncharacterized protein [Aegilops tauschii subsp. strangulata]|uniref:uncharacterized protein n=1 Tax=Aegilops tauschii subsp. strangulata TaxID=200361 RepID=UPI003CC88C49
MGKFRRFVDSNGLKELFLHGRAFTWSNERDNPTLTKIDRAFVSVDWELDHPDGLLQALSTAISDHCPLHLAMEDHLQPHRRFRFESFWTKLDGFDEAVVEAWTCDPSISDPFLRLDVLLRKTSHDLTAWGQRKIGNVKLQIAMANWIILQLDQLEDSVITDQNGKEEAFYNAYKELLGMYQAREHTIDLDCLGITPLDPQELDAIYTEEEVYSVIKSMPSERAPGPDGFIGLFFHRDWSIIKDDIMAAIHKL